MVTDTENPAVTRFREYLRFPSVHPDPDYASCIQWLRAQANEIGITFNYVEFPPPGGFTIWMTWKGQDPTLKSVLLNSHIDVVPVDVNRWTHDPFGAEKDAEGNIYARGSQDMKCVGVQYLEAIRRLKNKGFAPLRDIHVTFVPDEEVGTKGMYTFVTTPEFESLNIGLAFDEGIASPDETFEFYFGERSIWQIRITVSGTSGHGSLLLDDTAAEKLEKFIGKFLELRSEQQDLLKDSKLELGDVTSFNLTGLNGGYASNVIPSELSATLDMRITPKREFSEIKKIIDGLCEETGPGISYTNISQTAIGGLTPLEGNPWWTTFSQVCDDLKLTVNPKIFPAYTDSTLLRRLGIPAFGFSPMNNTPVLLHDNDEFLNEKVFLRGIEIYEAILQKMANLPKAASA